MAFLENLNSFPTVIYGYLVLILSFIFLIAWALDSKTHGELAKKEITDKELQTHRLILIPSILMELSLVGMYWSPWISLPFFLGFYLVRTVHEFIDEIHFHTDRCTKKESYYHLIMWCTVHIKTFLLFIWGFFLQFAGIESLPVIFYIVYIIITGLLGIITLIEFKR